MLRQRGVSVRRKDLTLATMDHSTPTRTEQVFGGAPPTLSAAARQVQQLERNCAESGIELLNMSSDLRGIVHIIGPELGLTRPGRTIVCGDSHTSTHGAFGALAFGIGTTEVGHVFATQCILQRKPKTFAITVNQKLHPGVTAKDLVLAIIGQIGVEGGTGHVLEYRGEAIRALNMEERMTVCNMSIEGGARAGYVNPDETTFAYLKGRPYAPKGAAWDEAVERWRALASEPGCHYDDVVNFAAADIAPTVTWGINPGQGISINETIPDPDKVTAVDEKAGIVEALAYMKLPPGAPIKGTKINVAFLGSCTNGRLSDFQEVARYLKGRRVAPGVKAIAVPGSQGVGMLCESLGLDKIFRDAGFEWRAAGCSMCLAMNPDKLIGDQLCASSSNRNFKGRQGSPTGRTILMSPLMVAAAAVTGAVADAREVFAVSQN